MRRRAYLEIDRFPEKGIAFIHSEGRLPAFVVF